MSKREIKRLSREILAYLKSQDEALTSVEIAEYLGFSTDISIRKVLKRLTRLNRVTALKVTVWGVTYDGSIEEIATESVYCCCSHAGGNLQYSDDLA